MAAVSREFIQGRQVQGEDERIAYRVSTTPWGSAPTSVVVVVKDVRASYADVTATNMTGSPSVVGDLITLPILHSLIAGKTYRIEVKFTSGGNVFEAYGHVQAER